MLGGPSLNHQISWCLPVPAPHLQESSRVSHTLNVQRTISTSTNGCMLTHIDSAIHYFNKHKWTHRHTHRLCNALSQQAQMDARTHTQTVQHTTSTSTNGCTLTHIDCATHYFNKHKWMHAHLVGALKPTPEPLCTSLSP